MYDPDNLNVPLQKFNCVVEDVEPFKVSLLIIPWLRNLSISILYTLSDLGVSDNLVGSLSRFVTL